MLLVDFIFQVISISHHTKNMLYLNTYIFSSLGEQFTKIEGLYSEFLFLSYVNTYLIKKTKTEESISTFMVYFQF